LFTVNPIVTQLLDWEFGKSAFQCMQPRICPANWLDGRAWLWITIVFRYENVEK